MELTEVLRLDLNGYYEQFYDSGEVYAFDNVVWIPIVGISGQLEGTTFDGATICLSVDQLRQLLGMVEGGE